VLENERVQLTPLKHEHLAILTSFLLQEPELWTYSLLQANTPEKMKVYIEKALLGRANGTTYPFIVFDKQIGRYAGSTRFYDIQVENAALQLGFTWYGRDFHGTGLNVNCKYLLLEFAFETLGVERVEFRADNENARSINAMKSIGCTVEGILRSNTYKPNGERRDSIVLSILRHEWMGSIKQQLSERIARQTEN
jgi:RimJ/RimL family protein N-acetyltransferase